MVLGESCTVHVCCCCAFFILLLSVRLNGWYTLAPPEREREHKEEERKARYARLGEVFSSSPKRPQAPGLIRTHTPSHNVYEFMYIVSRNGSQLWNWKMLMMESTRVCAAEGEKER